MQWMWAGDTCKSLLLAAILTLLALTFCWVGTVKAGKTGGSVVASDTNGVLIWTASSVEKVLKGQTPPDPPPEPVLQLEAAQNEYESAQIILSAGDRPVEDVSVMVSDLVGRDGVRIPSAEIKLYCQQYVGITVPSKNSPNPPGWYPDALLPLREPFTVAAGENQGIWLTVRIPKAQAPGVYEGAVEISWAGRGSKVVPLRLTVWDFELTDESHTRTAFAIWPYYVGQAHNLGDSDKGPQVMENYYWFFVEHRLPPMDLPTVTDGVLDFLDQAERFLNDPRVYSFRVPYRSNSLSTKRLVDALRERGWLDKGYFYLGDKIDEPAEDMYPQVKSYDDMLRTIAPDVQHVVTIHPLAALYGTVRTWCPHITLFDPAVAAERQDLGEHVWWYPTGHPYLIDDDLLGARLLSWMQRRYHVEGILYWATTYWPKDPWQGPASAPEEHGNGYLVYPGAPFGVDGPVGTVRLEAIRDGLEDYELLWLWEQRMQEVAERLGVTGMFHADDAIGVYYERLFHSVGAYLRDDAEFAEVRREIAAEISGALAEPLVLTQVARADANQATVVLFTEPESTVEYRGLKLAPTIREERCARYEIPVDVSGGDQEVRLVVSKDSQTKVVERKIVWAQACRFGSRPDERDGTGPDVVEVRQLTDFETPAAASPWTASFGRTSLSDEWASSGTYSLRVDLDANRQFAGVQVSTAALGSVVDWGDYSALVFDVYNPEDHLVEVHLKLFDPEKADDTHKLYVNAGCEATIRIPVASITVDPRRVQFMAFWVWAQSSPLTLYFDHFRLERYQ